MSIVSARGDDLRAFHNARAREAANNKGSKILIMSGPIAAVNKADKSKGELFHGHENVMRPYEPNGSYGPLGTRSSCSAFCCLR